MRSIPLLILAGCVTSSLLAQGKDIIVRKNGARIRGIEVTEFTHSGLKATRKGGEVLEIPGHLVLALEWGDLPEEFIAGRAAMERGDFATAVQMFGEAANKATRPLVKADCEFFQIKAAVAAIGDDSGAAQTAADKAKAWLTTNGDHWRVPEALLLAGRASRLAGNAADAMMAYFLFRQIIRTPDDLIRLVTLFIICSIGVAVSFIIENRTQQNMFHIFGGVPQFTDIRNGRLRCQGAFAHSILAGCFWACLIPLYCVRGWFGRGWLLTAIGIGTALLIVALSSSSTPIMSILFGILAGSTFLVRKALRWWRWLILAWLAVLHFVLMNMPVWHLLARVDIISGSTGWHRYHLVDKCIEYFPEWWMAGTLQTGHWGPGLHDVTNQYVAEGVTGGLGRLLLFTACVVTAFIGVSRSLRMPQQPPAYRYMVWALGTALFMHCMNFIGVSYFEQIVVEWHMTLAIASSLTLVPGADVSRQLQTSNVTDPRIPSAAPG